MKYLNADGTLVIDFQDTIRGRLTCSSSPPAPPDYVGAAYAQGAANEDVARVNARLNNPNVTSPYGGQTVTFGTFDQAGFDQAMQDYQFRLRRGDRNLGAAPTRDAYMINRDIPNVTQTFSPEQQALYDQQVRNQGLLGGLAEQGANALQGVVGRAVDFSGAPQTSNYDDTRRRVIDAYMSRANEDYGKRTDQSNSDLIAAGIRPGSKAYADAQQMIERSRNDAYQQAEIAGGNAASQAYGMDEARRRQGITEYLAQRQTPLNEVTALLSGSQVSNPFAMPGYNASANAQPAPIGAAAAQQGQYATDVYNAQQAQQGNTLGGLFSLGSSAIMRFSDRRLKSNIQRIGTHPLGIGYYAYDIAGRHEEGVMADEVLAVKPEAVHQHVSGYLMVDYGSL